MIVRKKIQVKRRERNEHKKEETSKDGTVVIEE
jgi:hypothetical protein